MTQLRAGRGRLGITNVELSEYFHVSPRLLPYVSELLRDLGALGSFPDVIVELLRDAGIGRESRVLDLGCGKGAVSIALARALGSKVIGVDAYEPFVQEAQQQATAAGVAHLCRFRVGDLKEEVKHSTGFDAVLYVSVGDVLGSLTRCVAALRQCVRPGGLIVLDDGYRISEELNFPGYQYLVDRDEALRQLTSHGDSIVREHLVPAEAIRLQNEQYTAWIEARARLLVSKHPGLAEDAREYLDMEREGSRILEESVQCVTWVLRRSDQPGGKR